ncbi:MAG: ATP synthase F1 subunit epsilon [Candidatus Eisenbacteria bacterium]|nr:ATP synthase F1 subunit epsilon [Candidatus Eisenbacteria bacterium]
MATLFQFQILTPESVVFEKEISSAIVPGTEGYLGILAHHAPLISGIVPGKVTVKDVDSRVQHFSVGGGFVEVSLNRAVLLADSIEAVSDIDIERARKSLERARERLSSRSPGTDVERAQASMARALNRIRIAEAVRE